MTHGGESIKKTTRDIFKQIHIYTTLIQEICTIFADKIPTYLVFKKGHFMLAQKFSTVYHVV
jgi:hypothetical protein